MRAAVKFVVLLVIIAGAGSSWAQDDLRAWYAQGQTWLVWKNADPWPVTYDVYRSDTPITDIAHATWAGRIYPEDGQAERLKIAYWFQNWVLPTPDGNTYELDPNEALFVYTPHAATTEYFAVVATGQNAVGSGNTDGPVAQSIEPIGCHLQRHAFTIEGGREYRIYALWVDGGDDADTGRDDFPVMANRWATGTGHVFAVLEPSEGRTGEPMPMVVGFHGGGESNYFNFGNDENPKLLINTSLDHGLVVSLDDALLVRKTNFLNQPIVDNENTRWFGYWDGFNRFEVPTHDPPADAVIYDYTMRRVNYVLDWLTANEEVDPARVSLLGVSGGASGAGFLIRRWPEKYSAATLFVLPIVGTIFPYADYMQGPSDANLATNLPSGMGLTDWYWFPTTLSDADMPYMRVIMGKQDTLGPWETVVDMADQVNDLQWGVHLYWDERDHILHWLGSHWVGSERHDLAALTQYRNDQSFPAFFNEDEDTAAPGRQPDIGHEGRESGDPWGTWGGYFDWDTESIEDSELDWSTEVFLFTESEFENDIPAQDAIQTDMTVRRPRAFHPEPGDTLIWTRTENDVVVQQGDSVVGDDGLAIVEGLMVAKTPSRVALHLEKKVEPADDDGDDTADDDMVDDDTDDDTDPVGGDDDDSDDSGSCGC